MSIPTALLLPGAVGRGAIGDGVPPADLRSRSPFEGNGRAAQVVVGASSSALIAGFLIERQAGFGNLCSFFGRFLFRALVHDANQSASGSPISFCPSPFMFAHKASNSGRNGQGVVKRGQGRVNQ